MKTLLLLLLRRSQGLVLLAVASSCLSGLAAIVVISVLQRGVRNSGHLSGQLILVFAGAEGTLLVAGSTSTRFLVRLSQNSIHDLRLHLCREIMDSSVPRLESIGLVRLQAALTDDVMMVSNAAQILPTFFVNSAILIGAFVYVGLLSAAALAVVIGVTVGCVALYGVPLRRANAHLRNSREHANELHQHMNAVIHGVKEIKLSRRRRESVTERGLHAAGSRMVDASVRGATWQGVAGAAGQVLFLAVIGTMIVAGPYLGLARGDLIGITLAMLYINTPLLGVLSILPLLNQAGVALSAIRSLNLGDEARSATTVAVSGARGGDIELRDVTYTYGGHCERSFTLGPVAARFTPGSLSFIVGGNGSGKTTLGKLICGLYKPGTGTVHLNARAVWAEDLPILREAISSVFADGYLFQSLVDGGELDRAAFDIEANRLLVSLGLAGKVRVTDAQFSTIAVSAGQRKRLMLVNAILENRLVMLFDEWSADQDPEFREFFYTKLLPGLRNQGKTVIVITHDDRYFCLADQILKLDFGKQTYCGPPRKQENSMRPTTGSSAEISRVAGLDNPQQP